MSHIPSEIVREILVRLPAESLLRFRSVCKVWRCIIDDPYFIRSHTINNQLVSTTLLIKSRSKEFYFLSLDSLNFTDYCQKIDATPFNIQLPVSGSMGDYSGRDDGCISSYSCNGLILMFDSVVGFNSWVILNPLTRKCHELPQPLDASFEDTWFFNGSRSGFGYDYIADDYKVVRIDMDHKTQIYSLKSDSWRRIGDCPYQVPFKSDGVFLNGAFHWESGDGERIIVLDLVTENYHQLSLPLEANRDLFILYLKAFDGRLFYFYHTTSGFHGWVMNEYGVEDSWMKLFSVEKTIPDIGLAKPVAYIKREKHVLLQRGNGLLSLDIDRGSVKVVFINGVSRIARSHLCTGSLFPLGG